MPFLDYRSNATHVPPHRFASIYDGADEVHRSTVARLTLREYSRGRGWECGTR